MSNENLVAPKIHKLLLENLTEIEDEIRSNHKKGSDMAFLYLHLGTIHGLMGDMEQQKIALEIGLQFDPDNPIIRARLAELIC